MLNELEAETYHALERGYSANPIVHAFQDTAHHFDITTVLLKPFFASMRTDLTAKTFTQQQYQDYIYGSAEVVGLMCLKVFCNGNQARYDHLQAGASKLGAAYQKVNFLRDIAQDHTDLGRMYFPGVQFEDFDEAQKTAIIEDIEADFAAALPYMRQLPKGAKSAVLASYRYYNALLIKLKQTPVQTIKTKRVRISNARKVALLLKPGKA